MEEEQPDKEDQEGEELEEDISRVQVEIEECSSQECVERVSQYSLSHSHASVNSHRLDV